MFHVLVFPVGVSTIMLRALPVHVLCFCQFRKILEKNRMYIVFLLRKFLFMLLFT